MSKKPSRRNKIESVLSGGVYVGNDTSHEVFADNFARNRGRNFVHLFSKKRLVNFYQLTSLFFDSHRPPARKRRGPVTYPPSFMSSRVRATLSAHSRAPAMASVRVLPCPPTSTSREPGRSCWLYRLLRSTMGRARLS